MGRYRNMTSESRFIVLFYLFVVVVNQGRMQSQQQMNMMDQRINLLILLLILEKQGPVMNPVMGGIISSFDIMFRSIYSNG